MADPYRELKSGKRVTWWDAMAKLKYLRSAFDLWVRRALTTAKHEDPEQWRYYLDGVALLLDSVAEDVHHWRRLLESERARVRNRERIAQLRNTTGRSAAEAAAFNRKADELEAQQKGN